MTQEESERQRFERLSRHDLQRADATKAALVAAEHARYPFQPALSLRSLRIGKAHTLDELSAPLPQPPHGEQQNGTCTSPRRPHFNRKSMSLAEQRSARLDALYQSHCDAEVECLFVSDLGERSVSSLAEAQTPSAAPLSVMTAEAATVSASSARDIGAGVAATENAPTGLPMVSATSVTDTTERGSEPSIAVPPPTGGSQPAAASCANCETELQSSEASRDVVGVGKESGTRSCSHGTRVQDSGAARSRPGTDLRPSTASSIVASVLSPPPKYTKSTLDLSRLDRLTEHMHLRERDRQRRGQEVEEARRVAEMAECTFTPTINRSAPKQPTAPVVVQGMDRFLELKRLATQQQAEKRAREEQVFFVNVRDKANPVGPTVPEPFRLSCEDPVLQERSMRQRQTLLQELEQQRLRAHPFRPNLSVNGAGAHLSRQARLQRILAEPDPDHDPDAALASHTPPVGGFDMAPLSSGPSPRSLTPPSVLYPWLSDASMAIDPLQLVSDSPYMSNVVL